MFYKRLQATLRIGLRRRLKKDLNRNELDLTFIVFQCFLFLKARLLRISPGGDIRKSLIIKTARVPANSV